MSSFTAILVAFYLIANNLSMYMRRTTNNKLTAHNFSF